MPDSRDEGIKNTSSAVSRSKNRRSKKDEQVIELSTGVKLKCKQIPDWLIVDLLNELNETRPAIPKYFDERRGIELDNPDDPKYEEALRDWTAKMGIAFGDAMIIEGTEIHTIPKGVPDHNNQDWIARMRALKRPVDNQYSRYLMWVKYVAAPKTDEDMELIMTEVGRLSGVREDDVSEVVGSFRNQGLRSTDTDDETE